MEIIPAIDIFKGKCVRLEKGNFSKKKIYEESPLKVARSFQRAGIKKVHIVDLEGAKEGRVKNWNVIRKIASNTHLLLQVGGGLRRREDLETLFRLGPHKAVLGTMVLKEPGRFRHILKTFGPEKIIVDVPFKNNLIYARGWQERTALDPISLLRRLETWGVKTVICTDIERDGTLRGPNIPLYRKLQRTFPNLTIIVSGGIRNKKDVAALQKAKMKGAIVGKAIYEKNIALKDLRSYIDDYDN